MLFDQGNGLKFINTFYLSKIKWKNAFVNKSEKFQNRFTLQPKTPPKL